MRPRRAPREPRSADVRVRLLWVLAVVLIGFALLVSKIADLQILSPERYRAVGVEQRTFAQTLAAPRGAIYDRKGVELAMTRPAASVFADPSMIEDPRAAAAIVAPVLGLDPADVESKMRTEGRFAYLARKVSPELASQVEALALPGVALLEEPERYHPSGDLAQSLLGTTDVDNQGVSGLEWMFGDTLTGIPGEITFERNPDGRTIAVGDQHQVPAQAGRSVVLTLDRSLQFETERILAEQVAATDATGGIAIVTKPETGEILAMANMVSDRGEGTVVPGTNNAALTTVYEPGSVMKVVTVSAAIEEGLVAPETVIQVPSQLQVADAVFTDAEEHGPLAWPVSQVLAHSSNIGTIKIAQQLGKDRLYEALRAFGFGEPTAVGFPDESAGRVPDPANPDQWWATSIGTVPIGQGVAVTPLQMLLAYNTIANDGVYVPARLVQGSIDADGTEVPVPLSEGRRVLSDTTSDEMNVMLREVVADGTGKQAAVHGYTPAGKTGTSRKPQANGSYYDENGIVQYQSTFVGFVPAEHPALSIIVIVDEPRAGGYTGGMVAAPAWSKIASFALRELGIAPPATDAPAGGSPVAHDDQSAESTTSTMATRNDEGKLRGPTAEQRPVVPLPKATGAGSTSTTAPAQTGKSPAGTG